AFDRLKASVDKQSTEEIVSPPLVSVVLTVFEPDEYRLLTSVYSILHQTWKNLELIVIDDCSGPSYRAVFERIAQLDCRINVIHLPENRGTYIARNVGYAASKGDYITGQDDDDWSHPQRLEHQVRYMTQNPNAIGCRVDAIRCDESLGKVRVGYLPHGQNASSLLIRREGYEKTGGFLQARKAADTEFYHRVVRATGKPIGDIKKPLS